MSLTAEQLRQRDGRLTASRVSCLMTGESDKIMDLWRYMVGDPAYVEPDLSCVWPVRLGEATEALNLDWYTRKTGRALSRHGQVVICRLADWAAATLDAWDDEFGCPVEAKCVGGFEARGKVVQRYFPQCHWQMLCTNARQVMLTIIEGGKEPAIEVVDWDETYGNELWRRAEIFMEHVRNLTPPVEMAPIAAPVKAEKVYDMAQSNAWAMHAGAWRDNRAAAKAFDTATKELKALIPADAAKAHGHGIVASRNKAGSISIKEA